MMFSQHRLASKGASEASTRAQIHVRRWLAPWNPSAHLNNAAKFRDHILRYHFLTDYCGLTIGFIKMGAIQAKLSIVVILDLFSEAGIPNSTVSLSQ